MIIDNRLLIKDAHIEVRFTRYVVEQITNTKKTLYPR